MAKKDGSALIDLAAVALAPAFITLMVGSLVAFLIEVIHPGPYAGRLHWTFFFFTVGAVLIARITIEQGRARAGVYAAALAAACFVAMLQFVEYPTPLMKALGPLVNLGLMALVWFCADRLTWDCTHFDDARTASGKGVLAAVGLDDDHRKSSEDDEVELTPKQQKLGWFERVEAYRAERRKRPHTPGTRVLYFGLAALPIFALGQSLIPADDAARRSATFFDMAVYIGSALALLVTTNLMGLRRYLSERGATISPVMTTSWLLLGGGLILGFLIVGAILPRPHSETALIDFTSKSTGDRKASKNAVVRDSSAGKGDGATGTKTEAGDGRASAKGGKSGGKSGEKGDGGGKGDGKGGDKSDGDKSGGKKGDDNDKGDGKKGDGSDKPGNKKGPNDAKKGDDGGKAGDQKPREDKPADGDATGDDAKNDGDQSGSSAVGEKLSQVTEMVGTFVKWVVWIVIAVAVVVGLLVFFLKYLAPFTIWAKNLLDWLRGLFDRKVKTRTRSDDGDDVPEAAVPRPAPFSAYTNPFARGGIARPPGEVVEYTFAALDGWAWERDLGRTPGETPTEFAVRLGHEFADLDEPAFAVAQLYVRTQYGRAPIVTGELKAVEKLWDELEALPHAARREQP